MNYSCRHAYCGTVGRDILNHESACSYTGIIAHRNGTQQSRLTAHKNTFSQTRCPPPPENIVIAIIENSERDTVLDITAGSNYGLRIYDNSYPIMVEMDRIVNLGRKGNIAIIKYALEYTQ